MNWNYWVRQIHRWVSIAFTVTVIANFIALAQGGGMPPPWVTVLAAAPARAAAVHRSVFVRAALCHQVAQRQRLASDITAHRRMTVAKKATPKAPDWREETLDRIRALILEADPEMIEERKWRKPSNGMAGVPVWSHNGIVCTGETYKNYVKMTFAKGAFVKDPSGLFNSSLEGNLRRAIDVREGDTINEKALKALIRAAVNVNLQDHG